MAKEDDKVELQGRISEAMGGGQYKVQIDDGTFVRARVGGKMKNHHVRVLPGDQVRVHVSQYDMTHGYIVFRSK